MHFCKITSIVLVICSMLLSSSCTWTTLRPHLIASSLFDFQGTDQLPLDSEAFNQEMYQLTGNRRHTNNQLLLLKNGEEIFPLLLELIGKAQKTIHIDQYAFHGKHFGCERNSLLLRNMEHRRSLCHSCFCPIAWSETDRGSGSFTPQPPHLH